MKLLGLSGLATAVIGLGMLAWVAVIIGSGAGINLFGRVNWDFSNPGAFGDSFGPLSALMASIAAVSAIAAYRSQTSEVTSLQLRQAADDEASSQERMRSLAREEELDRRVQKTTFEGTFFKLLDSFRSIVADIDIRTSHGATKSAQDAFQSILFFTENTSHAAGGNLREVWQTVIERYANDLNHYFRFMYHIVRSVHEANVENKYFYIEALKSDVV